MAIDGLRDDIDDLAQEVFTEIYRLDLTRLCPRHIVFGCTTATHDLARIGQQISDGFGGDAKFTQ